MAHISYLVKIQDQYGSDQTTIVCYCIFWKMNTKNILMKLDFHVFEWNNTILNEFVKCICRSWWRVLGIFLKHFHGNSSITIIYCYEKIVNGKFKNKRLYANTFFLNLDICTVSTNLTHIPNCCENSSWQFTTLNKTNHAKYICLPIACGVTIGPFYGWWSTEM